jgi:predicted RecA/RadA family phage recombinase
MTTKFQEVGEVKTYSNAGSAITAGSVVVMGSLLGIALTDIDATTGVGAVKITGVFANMPKTTGTAWTVGLSLNWDVSTSKFDSHAATPATGDVLGAAVAWEAAASGDATGVVLLTPNGAASVD